MATQELLKLLGQYQFSDPSSLFHRWLVRQVREQDLLIATKESETLLENLALTVERDQKLFRAKNKETLQKLRELRVIELAQDWRKEWQARRKHKKSANTDSDTPEQALKKPTKSDDFNLWYTNYVKQDKDRLGKWNDELLDEIFKLLEQIRAGRRDR